MMRSGKQWWGRFLLGCLLIGQGSVLWGPSAWGADGSPQLVINRGIPLRAAESTPTITGTAQAPAGSQVAVTIEGDTHTTAVLPGGTWTLTWPRPLAPGTYTIDAQLTDPSGQTATATQVLAVGGAGRLPRGPLVPSQDEPSPLEEAADADFQAMTDRWRIVPPPYEINVQGRWWDPYNQNVLKGDYPIYGNDLFFVVTGVSDSLLETRTVPTPSAVSSARPGAERFFGDDLQFFYNQNLVLSLNLFKGSTAFKPFDWQIKGTLIGNINYLDVRETGVVNADVRRGTDRLDGIAALQEMFAEVKLADLSPNYDFLSVRAGIQPFNSDFKGFVFSDSNLGIRIFGDFESNRNQFNLAFFDRLEKDTNSGLNRLDSRGQRVLIANFYRQDFLVKGYTTQFSLHHFWDDKSLKFNNNSFLARPDPIGSFTPHDIEATYFGWTSFGHYGRLNIDHAFYYVTGHDSKNPIAGRSVTIDAFMGALELSFDRDWIRPKVSYFYASGDSDPADDEARGFDSIFDNPNFAGGGFSFWNRLEVRLALPGVALVNRGSLVPDLRSSKEQGQPNFVNPGIHIFNTGVELELTPKLTTLFNVNYLMFDTTDTLEFVLFQKPISREIGWDVSVGARYRPFLNNNVIFLAGFATLFPGGGFSDIFATRSNLYLGFTNLTLLF
ncbi:MAG: Ig-like domain-containing protein [Thermodesulfobacteriota bacterium]